MSKGWMVNLALLLALLAGVATLWVLDHREQSEQTVERKSREISPVKADQVTGVHFVDGAGGEINLTKESQGGWAVAPPHAFRLDAKAVERLLAVLDARFERQVAATVAAADAAAFGLAKPEARLTVHGGGGGERTLILGGKAPASGQRYLRLGADGPLVLVPGEQLSGLSQQVDDLRDRRLLHDLTAARLQSVAVVRKGDRLSLSRAAEASWNMTSPLNDRASPSRLPVWLEGLLAGSALEFVEPPASPGDPDWTLTVTARESGEARISIWRQGDDLLARRPGESDAVRLSGHLAETLDKPALELVDLRPLGDGSPPSRLLVRQGETIREAVKKEGRWPLPAWDDIEEILTREAWRGTIPVTQAAPWLVVTVGSGADAPEIPLYRRGETLFLAPPGRPVALELTRLQSESVEKSVAVVFQAPEK